MAEISWIVPAASIVAAVIVAFANGGVQRWRYSVDRLASSVDLLCAEINAAADLATEYWLKEASAEARDLDRSVRAIEAQLIGRQIRLQEIVVVLAEQDRRLVLDTVEAHFPDLFEAMTGGNFQVDGRSIDPERARLVQASAAILNGHIRRAMSSRLRRWWQ